MFERKLFNDLLARMKTMQIVAIGGGELKDRETLRISAREYSVPTLMRNGGRNHLRK